jgi:hypothetical protein
MEGLRTWPYVASIHAPDLCLTGQRQVKIPRRAHALAIMLNGNNCPQNFPIAAAGEADADQQDYGSKSFAYGAGKGKRPQRKTA